MFNKNELFASLLEDFSQAVNEYRTAKKESEINKPIFMNDEQEEQDYKEYQDRMKSLTTSKDYIKITREEYWQNILQAKIEVISKIGGFEMMQEFHKYLYEHPNNDALSLYSAFDYFADGIGGWCR